MVGLREFNIIVAATNGGGIGYKGALPWSIPGDLAFFRKLTTQTQCSGMRNAVIMGRKTWNSIPGKFRPLASRLNVVLSTSPDVREVEGIPSDVVLATSLRDALSILASDQYSKDVESVYLIGGSAAYCEAFDPKADLPCANIYLTRVHSPVDCDVFIPEIPDSLFVLDEMLPRMTDNGFVYQHTVYRNRKLLNLSRSSRPIQTLRTQVRPIGAVTDNAPSASTLWEKHANFVNSLTRVEPASQDERTGEGAKSNTIPVFENGSVENCTMALLPSNSTLLRPVATSLTFHEEYQYLNIIRDVITTGDDRGDRTGVGTFSKFGVQTRWSLRDNTFPLLTTKRVFWRGVAEELLWFIKGSTNTNELRDKGIRIWDGNSSKEFLTQRGFPDREVGDLGPCFPSGTSVLTFSGYKPIETVKLGELVYTHTGSFHPVTDVMSRSYSGPMINISPEYILGPIACTPEHPFFVRTFSVCDRVEIDGVEKRNVVSHGEPTFLPAKDIDHKKHLLGFKIEDEEVVPEFKLRRWLPGRNDFESYSLRVDSADVFWMMGLFVGDGWLVDDDHCVQINFAVCNTQIEEIVPKLQRVLNVTAANDGNDGAKKYRCINAEMAQILQTFGKYSHEKIIPDWMHKAPKPLIRAFLDGYERADDCKQVERQQARRLTSVNRDLILSVQRLYLKLGFIGAISMDKHEGLVKEIRPERLSEIRDAYFFEVYETKQQRSDCSFIEDGYAWFSIRSITTTETVASPVYNFTVANDNTYTVQNLSVHNCYGFQWRHFGADYVDMNTDYSGQGVDQLADVINTIKTNPEDRRIILTAWNPAALSLMALPPCHMFAQFYVSNGELSCQMYQRSADLGLGVPFNIASYALLVRLIAQVCGLKAGELVHVIGDAHVYKNHVEALQLQLQRVPRAFPKLYIREGVTNIDDFVFSDFALEGYEPHPPIPMQMAV